ncbi:MAG: hypothetical protein JW726_09400 [Anaerolineales bacterium]|nr:hypothetical protein [Anaerolineales bacterium]
MKHIKRRSGFYRLFLILLLAVFASTSLGLPGVQSVNAAAGRYSHSAQATSDPIIYTLPVVLKEDPWRSPFGAEVTAGLHDGSLMLERATSLPSSWVRMNGRISWRALQPNEGDEINWSLLEYFERELRALKAAGMIPIVVVDDYPRWATDNTVRLDGQPTSCGPLLPDRYDDFATFMQALVSRYRISEFDVHIWELGNEPDVDPNLVSPDSVYGCWGDQDELYYNGDAYGEMLKVVTPAIKAIDPQAKVWIGGLLMNRPDTNDPGHIGRPELFLKGILEAGAADSFDVVSFHAYSSSTDQRVDQDLYGTSPWNSWGGSMLGKMRFLRDIMDDYGVDKPLFTTETGLAWGWGEPPAFFNDWQANYAVRTFSRALAEGIMGFTWFTLNGPGWRYLGLLDENQTPKPVYTAYQNLITRLDHTSYLGLANYGVGIEAYNFARGGEKVQVVWAVDDTTFMITVPQAEFIAAYTRDGATITPTASGTDYQLTVQFEPIYIIRNR